MGLTEETGLITLAGADKSDTVDIELFPETGYGTLYDVLISISSAVGTAPTTWDIEIWDRKYVIGTCIEDGTQTLVKQDTITASDFKIVNDTDSTLGKIIVKNQETDEKGYVSAYVKGNGGDGTTAYTITVKLKGVESGW